MRSIRFLVFSLIACAPLLFPSEATAIGCWLCQHQRSTCLYYASANNQWCADGCIRNPYPHCSADCSNILLSDVLACENDYEWCAEGCIADPPEIPKQNCPIVIDLGQHGFKFTSVGEGVLFDIDGNGRRDPIAWTDPDTQEGFLVWDRNLNGIIDSGRELFGDSTVQPPSSNPNGFLALALLDRPENGGNVDGAISNQDSMWSALQVWVDRNHNGRSEAGELSSLYSHKIASIDLAFRESRRKDRYGNELRYRSQVLLHDGKATQAVDVFFQGH